MIARRLLLAGCVLIGAWLVVPTLVAVPVGFSGTRAFVLPPQGWSLQWYENLFTDRRWWDATRNSLVIALLTTVVATVTGTFTALALDRSEFPGKGVVVALLFSPAIVPVILLAIGLFYLFLRLRLAGTIGGLVLAHSVIGMPIVVRTVTASLGERDRRIEQAAAGLGAGPVAVFRDVTLPLVAPGVFAGAVFAFLGSFDEVVLSVFLTSPQTQTLPVLMFNAVTREVDPTIAAASTVVLVFTTLLILIGMRLGRKGLVSRVI
ncbi:ABC transporter permease [Pseudonocardia zijingensis]|uniref:ABC transporter permease n=1 Tax=Pseudonocardia zijingensis TaxID=153376 RepID=A0ABN1N7A1_9PSEU